MRIGLLDVDNSERFPNLCLMKLSAWYKAQGDTVEWWNGFVHYDVVYMSKVFTDMYTADNRTVINADAVFKGGTGYNLHNRLPDVVEHAYPDYHLYPHFPAAYGFLTRGCPRRCGFCIVGEKEGYISTQVAELSEFWRGQHDIRLLDPNLLASKEHERLLLQLAGSGAWIDFTQGLDARLLNADNIRLLLQLKIRKLHFAWDSEQDSNRIVNKLQLFQDTTRLDYHKVSVYVLVNHGTTLEFDLFRIYTLREMGLSPYIMVYDKPNAPGYALQLQRWVNNRYVWKTCSRFKDYMKVQASLPDGQLSLEGRDSFG